MSLALDTVLLASPIPLPENGEDVFEHLSRVHGKFDLENYAILLGSANEFKEGDQIIGVAATDATSRANARELLSSTRLGKIDAHPPHTDEVYRFGNAARIPRLTHQTEDWTFADLKSFLLKSEAQKIKAIMPGLSSDVIGCVVKLMSNAELVTVAKKVFNPLPGTNIGAEGYLGARVQPNSPTDHPDDIRWQVFDAFSYAVGDVLLGTNPVSSEVASVAQIEDTLKEICSVFEIEDLLPHCVLSHIDVQSQVELEHPESTALWFQSIAGTDAANETFDLSVAKMKDYAATRNGRYGLYFETGQGADFTNGHGHGFDMVLHESRKYGFARALQQQVARTRQSDNAWVHLNDVAGFIGPEVFRTKEQLVRCCLEDIVMGKLHGLCIGLDVCSTLHMDVSLDDLDWCLDQIMPANPAYLMALPTKIDPMLGYLTTGYQDHVRLREKFGFKVNDAMWKFFQQLQVIDAEGRPTRHFGDPTWVYQQFLRKKGDTRAAEEIRSEGQNTITQIRQRGLFIAEGYGESPVDLQPQLATQIREIYQDGKRSIWAELTEEFRHSIPNNVQLSTESKDRSDYILHPESGEKLSTTALVSLDRLRRGRNGSVDVQMIISDGLNAHSIMDEGHVVPFLNHVRRSLKESGQRVGEENLVVTSGRVRTGYRIGEQLFQDNTGTKTILHLIGERPGTGHHTFSVYITSTDASHWSIPNKVDHNITKVVSGIALTALRPEEGAEAVLRILKSLG